jgi:hypothetical protein
MMQSRFLGLHLTSNRPLEEWGKLLSHVPTVGAIREPGKQEAAEVQRNFERPGA